jgi:hypothetical protein
VEQYGREAQQQDVANTLAFMKHDEAARTASEDRKLQLAAMLQKAQEDRALKEELAGKSDTTKRRGQDLTNEDRDMMRSLKEEQDKIKAAMAERKQNEVERHNPVAEGNAAAGNMVQYAGQQNAQTGAPRNQVVETSPETGLPTKVAPAAGPPPGSTPISKNTRAKEEQEVAGMADLAPYFTRLIDRLHQPESAKYFGIEQGGVAIPKEMPLVGGIHLPGLNLKHNLASLGIGSEEELKNAKGYNEIKQMMTDLENARVLEQSGKVVNQEELGRVQEAMGRIRNAPFSNKIEIMLPALEQAYQALRAGYARKNQQLQQGYLPGELPDVASSTTRREPPAQVAKIDLNDPKAFYQKDLEAAKARIQSGKLKRTDAEALFQQHYGSSFNPSDLD